MTENQDNRGIKLTPHTHKAQYYETDQMGIVHHSNYIRWFEEARVRLLDEIGFGYTRMESEGIISPVLSMSCEYKSMVKFGDCVYVLPKVEEFNGVKLKVSYKVIDVNTGELRTTGASSHCFLDRDYKPVNLKKTNMPLYEAVKGCIGLEIEI